MPEVIIYKSDARCIKEISKRGKILRDLPIINAYAVKISQKDLEELKNTSCAIKYAASTGVAAQQSAVQRLNFVNPEGLTGHGVGVAVLDTGTSPLPVFENRITAFKDIINSRTKPYDDNSHGTHVCGILGAKGRLPGIAAEADIISVKVLDKQGAGSSSDLLGGLQWVYDNYKKYNIRIVNLSVGSEAPDTFDPLVSAAEVLWDSGITVVAAAGNNGPSPCSVTSPGTSKKIITVGCADDDTICDIWDTAVKDFSGRGPTRDCIVKPDVLAPGAEIISCSANGSYIPLSGTSMSVPMVSGAIALLLQKRPHLTPNEIKYHLKQTSTDLSCPKNRQGWGLINITDLLSKCPVHL